MYDKLLKQVESWILTKEKMTTVNTKTLNDYLDCIIKIKTIQAMDVNAELIRASRRVSRYQGGNMKVYKNWHGVNVEACCDEAKEMFDHISTEIEEDYITYTDWGNMFTCPIHFKYCPFCGEKIKIKIIRNWEL